MSLHTAIAFAGLLSTALLAPETRADDGLVDLSGEELDAVPRTESNHVLSSPWWQNLEIHGFGGAGFYDTGANGTRPHGGFAIKEASLFVHADVWQNIELYFELQTNRLGKDGELYTRTGEVNIHFRDLWVSDHVELGAKLGRIDLPFGEEYLAQDAIDNPLITQSASYVYGWDEGVALYGRVGPLNFIGSLTDGTDDRSKEDHHSKAVSLKISQSPAPRLYWSVSAMHNGKSAESGLEFGGSHFEPVGASHVSTLGISPSAVVESALVQLDLRFDVFGDRGYVAAHYGAAQQNDAVSRFDRDFQWFGIEALLKFTPSWYAAARYSEIGTYDRDEGYHFDGKIFAGGNAAFGYDTRRFRRLGVGIGYVPNPHLRIKAEAGRDWFDLIDASTRSGTDNRDFLGFEVAVGF